MIAIEFPGDGAAHEPLAPHQVTTPARPIVATVHTLVCKGSTFRCVNCSMERLPVIGAGQVQVLFEVATAGVPGVIFTALRPRTNFIVPCYPFGKTPPFDKAKTIALWKGIAGGAA